MYLGMLHSSKVIIFVGLLCFSKELTWHSLSGRKWAEIGQKWDFRALFSEIYMKIEVFSSLEHNSTRAPIAQLAERLTFFI